VHVVDVVDGANVGMLDARGDLGLAVEALDGNVVVLGEAGHLEGDTAVEPGIQGEIDRPHSARADARQDLVATKRSVQFCWLGHDTLTPPSAPCGFAKPRAATYPCVAAGSSGGGAPNINRSTRLTTNSNTAPVPPSSSISVRSKNNTCKGG